MANKKNNDDSLIVEMGVDTKNAEKEIKEFFNKVNTKKYIKIEIDPTSSKKQEILTKETATWTEKTGKYTERNITLTKQYNTTKAQGNKEAEKQLISEQKVEGSVRLQKETLKEAINLLKQQTEYINKSAKSTGEQRVAYELLAKEAEKKLKAIANEVEQGVKVNSLLRENSSYLQQEYNLRTAMVNKDMTVKAEQQKLAYLKEELALSQKLMATQNQYAIYKANSDAALKNYRTAFQNVGDSWLNSSSFLGKAINTFQYGAIGKAQAEVYQLMSDGAQAIIQFENGIVDLRRTLENVTENELTQFGETALRYAKEYGQELANVQDSMTELARAGIDKDQLESMTQTVMIGLNTTEIKDAEEMVGYLVSAIKQLGMSMEDSMVIIDSWNMLADRYAVHTDDFAKAIAKAGAASKNMGLDLYDVNAMVTILGEATQASGEQIGNALRSLEVRLLRPDTISTLEKYGIVVKKDADSFLSFQEILNNVAEVIKDLPDDSIVLSDIMDAMGGSWRKNWITTLTNDWDRFDALVEEQADNVGYSARENEIAMDTLEKKMISLKQAWLELFVTMGNESGVVDILKGLVDGTTSLLELATNTELGKFITSLIPAAAALGVVMKTVQSMGEAKGGTAVSKIIGGALSMGGNLKTNQQIAEQYLQTLSATGVELEQRLAIAEVLDKKFKTNTAIILENERAEEDYKKKLEAVNSELNNRKKRFDELDLRQKSGVSLTNLETIELEENGRAIVNLTQQQNNLAESHRMAAAQAYTNAAATKSLGNAITALRTKMIATRAAAFAFGTVLSMVGAVLLSVVVTKVFDFFDDLYVSLEEQKEITENLVSELQSLQSELSNLEQQRDSSVDPKEIKDLEFKITLQKESIRLKEEEIKLSQQEEYKKMGLGRDDIVFDYTDEYSGNQQTMKYLSEETRLLNEHQKAVEELNKAMSEGNNKAVEEYQKKLNELGTDILEVINVTEEAIGENGEYSESYLKLKDYYMEYANAKQEEVKSTDVLTYISEKYADTLKLEGDTHKFVTQAAKEAAIEQEKIERAKTKNLYNETMTRIGVLKAGAKANIPQGSMTSTEYARHINAYSSEEIAAETKLLAEYQAQIKAADNAIKELEQMRVINTSLSSLSSDSGSKSSSASPIETKDDFQAVIDGIQLKAEKQKELNDLYQQNIDLMEVMYNEQGRLAYEEDLLEGQKNLVNQLKDENEKLISLKEDLVKTYGYGIEQVNQWFDENGNLTLKYYEDLNSYVGKTDDASKEAQEALEDLANKVSTIHNEIKDNLTDIQELEIEWVEKTSSLAREYIELEQENKLNKLEDEYEKRLADIAKEVYGTENIEDYDTVIEKQIETLQNKIDTLKEIGDQEDAELEKQEKLLAIEEARIKLANAQKNKTVAVLRKQADGTYQNEYIADPDAIKEAQDELTQAELDYNEYIDQLKIESLEEQIDAL